MESRGKFRNLRNISGASRRKWNMEWLRTARPASSRSLKTTRIQMDWKRCFLHLQHQSRTWCIVWWLSCKTTESLHPDDYCAVFKPNFDILSLSIIIFCYLILPFCYILETNVLFYFTAFIWATTDYSYKFRLRAASEPNECMCVINLFFQQHHENKLHKTNTDSNNQKNAEYQIW